MHFFTDYPVSFSKEINIFIYIYIYIYQRVMFKYINFVYSRGLVVRVVDLRPRVRGLLESASWPCVCTQVKDGSLIVIWTACKITLDQ